MSSDQIKVTIYRWEGQFGPLKINIPCGECSLTADIVDDVLKTDFEHIAVDVESYPWLDNWWKPLLKGGWHAPIVLVDGQLISQGVALNRGVLIEAVATAHAHRTQLQGNHLFGKQNCTFCRQAKQDLTAANINFIYHDVIESTQALYEMLARVKPLIGAKAPVTVPQIWLDGVYVGGAQALRSYLRKNAYPPARDDTVV